MDQLKVGIKVEHEHKPTYDWMIKYLTENEDFPTLEEFAKHISQDHLREKGHEDYYSVLVNAGLANEVKKNDPLLKEKRMINYNQFDAYDEDVADHDPMMNDDDYEHPNSPALTMEEDVVGFIEFREDDECDDMRLHQRILSIL